jgi:hypothetical protein
MAKRQTRKKTTNKKKTKVRSLSKGTSKKKTNIPKKKTSTTKKLIRKRSEDDYVRLSSKAKLSRFIEFGEKIQRGELKWSHYAIDGNVGYHYYLKLK